MQGIRLALAAGAFLASMAAASDAPLPAAPCQERLAWDQALCMSGGFQSYVMRLLR